MTVLAWIPLLVAILSAVLFCLVKNPDVKQLAGWSFLAAMIAFMISMNHDTIRLGHGPS